MICLDFLYKVSLLQSNKKIQIQRERKICNYLCIKQHKKIVRSRLAFKFLQNNTKCGR